MGKVWKNDRKGIKDFKRSLRKGMTVWTVVEHHLIAGQFDKYSSSAHTCTGTHPLLGGWMFGITSAETLIRESADGCVYDSPPSHIRDLADPEPDCRNEGSNGYRGLGPGRIFRGPLSPANIAKMERHAQDAEDDFQKEKANRGRWGSR